MGLIKGPELKTAAKEVAPLPKNLCTFPLGGEAEDGGCGEYGEMGVCG